MISEELEIQEQTESQEAQELQTESLEDYALPNHLEDEQAQSVIESLLFASHKPMTVSMLRGVFHGTNINSDKIRKLLTELQTQYSGGERGLSLEEVGGGYQLRTKSDNSGWIRKMIKARPFRVSGPALEVLSIIAYKQPIIKHEIDLIRGVESGHLVRALMERNLVRFDGKSELPGKPMQYATTKEFLEIFGIRSIKELPSLSEIDELLPEGIGNADEIEGGESLDTLTDKMALPMGASYSDSENELLAINDDLSKITTTTEFFEQEKKRERERRDQERAQDLRERKIIGETLDETDEKWLQRYETRLEPTKISEV